MKKNYAILSKSLILSLEDGTTPIDLKSLISGPALTPRDEAILLLTVAAEIEHALMVQYLYAAYSVRHDQTNHEIQGRALGIKARLLQIAREEMGHLITVENLLHLLGGPLNFERENSPFESELYPIRFKLEKLSIHSLAKYITVESPIEQPDTVPDDVWREVIWLRSVAKRANDGHPVKHVGPIYARLIELFEKCEDSLKDEDFRTDMASLQATWRDWGYDASLTGGGDTRKVQVDTFESYDPDSLRKQAIKALTEIEEQGEGAGACVDSHFERFFEIYQDFNRLNGQGVDFIWPVATNPTTLPPSPQPTIKSDLAGAARCAFETAGYISNGRARYWAELFNFRYRLLLAYLMHFLSVNGVRYVQDGPDKGDRAPRGFLLMWTFDEMRYVKKLAEKLVQLPLHSDNSSPNAAPPFQLPYTFALASNEQSRWRMHLDVVKASLKHLEDAPDEDKSDPFLEDMYNADKQREKILSALAIGQPLPADSNFKKFKKVAYILEESIRKFPIQAHHNFWANKNRDEFVHLHPFNREFIKAIPTDDEEACEEFTATGSELVSDLDSNSRTSTMPRYRPHVDASRQEFIKDWINDKAKDNDPPNQIGVMVENNPTPEPSPKADAISFAVQSLDTPSYQADIRPLFRDFDVDALKHLDNIDLNDVADVQANGKALQEQIEAGTFPYDACWPPEQIDLFGRWVEGGMKV
jgi:rubrerythrin